MLTFLAGPVFFAAAITCIVLGLAFLAMLWREGWIIVACGLLAMGFAVPGWLTVVGVVGGGGSICTFAFWRSRKIGRSF